MTSTKLSHFTRNVNPARSLIVVSVVAAIALALAVAFLGGAFSLWMMPDLAPIVSTGLLWGVIPTVVAIILARRDRKTFAERDARSRSLVRAGLITGYVVVGVAVAFFAAFAGIAVSWFINGD